MAATAVIPDRTHRQRLEALARGQAIRLRRAQLKRDMNAKRVELVDVLQDPPDWMDTAKVYEFLQAQRGWGVEKTRCLLERCQVSHSKTIGGLTDRQRSAIIEMLQR